MERYKYSVPRSMRQEGTSADIAQGGQRHRDARAPSVPCLAMWSQCERMHLGGVRFGGTAPLLLTSGRAYRQSRKGAKVDLGGVPKQGLSLLRGPLALSAQRRRECARDPPNSNEVACDSRSLASTQ